MRETHVQNQNHRKKSLRGAIAFARGALWSYSRYKSLRILLIRKETWRQKGVSAKIVAEGRSQNQPGWAHLGVIVSAPAGDRGSWGEGKKGESGRKKRTGLEKCSGRRFKKTTKKTRSSTIPENRTTIIQEGAWLYIWTAWGRRKKKGKRRLKAQVTTDGVQSRCLQRFRVGRG